MDWCLIFSLREEYSFGLAIDYSSYPIWNMRQVSGDSKEFFRVSCNSIEHFLCGTWNFWVIWTILEAKQQWQTIEKFQTQFVNCWSLSSNRVKFSIECSLIFSIQDNLSFFLCWEAVFPIISPNLAFKLLFSITYYWNCGAQQTESNELQIPSYLKWSVQWVPVCSSFSHLR